MGTPLQSQGKAGKSVMSSAVAAQVEQNQRAFQKQDNIFVGKKRVLGAKKPGIRETRYYKSVGLGIETPRTAIEGTYVDKKCPWTGSVNIRGKMLTGVIRTTKMKNTAVHVSPAFRVKVGDEILAGQCRPLCKTVRFNMLKILRSSGGKKGFDGM